jgi:lysyl-tRNA synthetase class 2
MATLNELRNIRLEKLEKLKQLGVDPFPARTTKDTNNGDISSDFEKFENKEVVVAGRIRSMRTYKDLAFFDIKDASGKIQLYIKNAVLETPDYQKSEIGFSDFNLLDTGDFVEAKGIVVKTKTGETSVEVKTLRLLTKSLRPMPDQWDGLKDKETRLRKRYLDTNINDDVYQRFIRRAKFWEAQREFFKSYGFLETNIPVLENIPGGADATPFVTHMNAIDQDFYLRISQELYLKRLIGGGYERVYEVGPRFRNEGLSDEHLPEHMAMEFYWAYADWKEGMEFVKKLFMHVLDTVYEGRRNFKIRGMEVDFGKEWELLDFTKVIKDKFGIDIHTAKLSELQAELKKHHVKGKFDNIHRAVDGLWKELRKEVAGPAFLINHPKFLSPLSKSHYERPEITERFQVIIAGSELGNGWSENNDPIAQYNDFAEQQEMRDSGDDEAQWLDLDYVEMLEYGMPPTFGYGHSERVFWFLEDVTAREGVPFPQLKNVVDDVNEKIYGLTSIK